MRRAPALVLVALLALPGVASSLAAEGCSVLVDPAFDAAVAPGAAASADAPAVAARDDRAAIDIRAVRMAVAGDALAVRVHVRDVSAPPLLGSAEYAVSWRLGARGWFVRAERFDDRWAFERGSDSGTIATAGSIDRVADVIEIAMPLQDLGADAGAVLSDVRAASAERRHDGKTSVVVFADRAPNAGAGRFVIDDACAASLSASGERCAIATDDARDATPAAEETPSEGARRDATEILALRAAANATTMVLEVQVAGLRGGDDARWEISWRNPRWDEEHLAQTATGERRGERVEFWYRRGSDEAISTAGTLERARGIVRILVPRAAMRLETGTRIDDVRASSFALRDAVAEPRDAAGGTTGWVVGPRCDEDEVQPCPVVLDAAGDARAAEATENAASLDILAVGVSPSDGSYTFSVRVADLRATPPPGSDVIGWTVSWLDGSTRWYAQAERLGEGARFRHGTKNGSSAAPSFGGAAATGTIGARANVVTIDVPRSAVTAATLQGVSATAWAITGGNAAAPYRVLDTTGARRYSVGIACGV